MKKTGKEILHDFGLRGYRPVPVRDYFRAVFHRKTRSLVGLLYYWFPVAVAIILDATFVRPPDSPPEIGMLVLLAITTGEVAQRIHSIACIVASAARERERRDRENIATSSSKRQEASRE